MEFPLHLQTITVCQQAFSLFIPDEESVKQAYRKNEIDFPFWSRVWPAAIALAEFLLEHPGYTFGKKVVELGGGLGLPSLVAAQNADGVLCTDYRAEAVAIAQRSAAHNGLTHLRTAVADWRQLPGDLEADTLLLSDVNYEPTAFARLLQVLERFLKKKTTVVLATPQRLVAKEFLVPLLPYCTNQAVFRVQEEERSTAVSVLVLQQEEE